MNENEVAVFEKVSYERFKEDFYTKCAATCDTQEITEEWLLDVWEGIRLPSRATVGSAGYDFFLPYACTFTDQNWLMIPTGIRCYIKPDWFLMMCPKSGQGFNYGFHLANTVGIIDSDYYNAANEGHILVKMRARVPYMRLEQGRKFVQGIFLPYGVTFDDDAEARRTGGFGSTDSTDNTGITYEN